MTDYLDANDPDFKKKLANHKLEDNFDVIFKYNGRNQSGKGLIELQGTKLFYKTQKRTLKLFFFLALFFTFIAYFILVNDGILFFTPVSDVLLFIFAALAFGCWYLTLMYNLTGYIRFKNSDNYESGLKIIGEYDKLFSILPKNLQDQVVMSGKKWMWKNKNYKMLLRYFNGVGGSPTTN